MIVYHVDTLGYIREGETLDRYHGKTPIYRLYPNGVSSYGDRAFLKPCNQDQAAIQAIDIMFDYVRSVRFPDKPSRFTSVFASASLEDSRAWREKILRDFDKDTDGSRAPSSCGIYAVEAGSVYIADARFLDCGNVLQGTLPALSNVLPYAFAYWNSVQEIRTGQMQSLGRSYALPELLLVPPVRVLYRV